ncbi:MAG: hypothetical protein ACOYBG_09385 [Eubacteriales bacterium]|jgi:hypothetical protein
MSILGLLGLGAFLIGDQISTNAKRRRLQDDALARGAYRPSSNKFEMYLQDVWDDWRDGAKMFPKEYRKYLAHNPLALKAYVVAQAKQLEFEDGYYPTGVIRFNCYDFDPFRSFNHDYAEKIEIFNKTGKLYY